MRRLIAIGAAAIVTLVGVGWCSPPDAPVASAQGLAKASKTTKCAKLTSTRWKKLREVNSTSNRVYVYAKRIAACKTLIGLRRKAVREWLGRPESAGRRGESWALGENDFGDTRRLVVEYKRKKAKQVYVIK
jgi:hypothetical protein